MTRLVVDANVVMSALIADAKSRELIVTLEPTLLTPAVIHDEIKRHEPELLEKSGLTRRRVRQFLDLLFSYIDTVPASEFHHRIAEAEAAIGDTDPDDVLYLACALARDASIWSDDSDFEEQDRVPVFTTADVVESFETA